MADTVLFVRNNNIATITFNRPQHMNTLDPEMIEHLEKITEEVRHDSAIRAVILQGAGKLFMAGGDIHYFHEHIDELPKHVKKFVHSLNTSISNLMFMPKPVIAAVHGSVAGVGMSFMLAADLVIASGTTKFTTAYSGIGISPDGGLSFNLPRVVGLRKAMELVLLGEMLDANQALNLGLVNWVVPEAELIERVNTLAGRLSQGPTATYARAKRLLNQACQMELSEQLDAEAQAFADCTASQDFRRGVEAFLNKQKPVFEGK